MPSPVLDLIQGWLAIERDDPFGKDIHQCLGLAKGSKVRQCGSTASHKTDLAVANYLLSGFALRDEIPQHDLFFFHRDIETFLKHSHCGWHANEALARFEAWKQTQYSVPPSPPSPPSPPQPQVDSAADSSAAVSRSGANAPVVQSTSATPRPPGSFPTDEHDEQDSQQISPSSTVSTVSPGVKNEFRFSRASLAQTDVTTPGSLLSGASPSSGDPGRSPSHDARYPPETPTRAPRHVKTSFVDLTVPSPSELADSFGQLNLGEQKTSSPEPLGFARPSKARTSFIDLTAPSPSDLADSLAQLHLSQPRIPGPEVLGPLIAGTPKTFRKRVKNLKEALLSPLEKPKDREIGRVYVFPHNKNPRILKIGYTRYDSDHRRAQSGNHVQDITTVFFESKENFLGAYRAEQIVLRQLDEHKINFLCKVKKCRTKRHREWFEHDAIKAKVLLEQWTEFVKMAYDLNGKITQIARHLVEGMVHDLEPNVPELLRCLAIARPVKAVHAKARRPVLVRKTARVAAFVGGGTGKHVNFLFRGEEDVFTDEPPDSSSRCSDNDISQSEAPDPGAAPAAIQPHERRNSWKDKAQSTRDFFSSLKRAAHVHPRPGTSRHPPLENDNGTGKEVQRMSNSTLPQLESELRLVEDRMESRKAQRLEVRTSISSWVSNPS